MKILITGIGIVGKSTLRRQLLQKMRTAGAKVEHFDVDCFDSVRHPLDIDCLKELPQEFSQDTIYLIEDVHATLPQAIIPLSEYDLIIYLKIGATAQILFWKSRIAHWFATGQYAWEAKTGWQGNRRPHSLLNLFGIFKNLFRNIYYRKKWIAMDWQKIRQHPNVQVMQSTWSRRGPKYTF
ncbi:MAG TPA: hypothetical protein PKI61_02450 [bacterium]|mgnify:FL=1|nr:hypothetical protein [bacterium]HPT30135.1 hypothetical protein [bacterium]